jgi:preprotein translocase subunit YajC
MKERRIMSWIPLTIFIAVMFFAYYLADQLDKQDEREHQQRIKALAKKSQFISSPQ